MSENVPPGFSILQTRAYDADEGPNAIIAYKIVPARPNAGPLPFDIDAESGWIR